MAIAGDFCRAYRSSSNLELAAVALELQAYLPSMQTVVATARRANMEGETVPASERVFSLFEPHTELIKRGRRQKPVEFGHKVLLCETAEKFITDYEVYEKQQAGLRLDRVGDRASREAVRRAAGGVGGGQGLLPGGGEVRGVGRSWCDTLAIPRRMQDFMDKVLAQLAGVPGRDRGDYFRPETRISAGSLFLSRV